MSGKAARLWLKHRYRAFHGSRLEIRRAQGCDYMVISRAKSGRTWLRAMLSRLYQQRFHLAEDQLLEYDNFHKQDPGAATVYFSHGHYLRHRFMKPSWQRRFASKRIVFMVRDPRDVAVSEYFQSTKRATAQKRELLGVERETPMFPFVMESKVGLAASIQYMNDWAPVVDKLENAIMVRYEDMRERPVEGLRTLVDFLGAPFSDQEIRDAVEFASFENLKKLEKEDFFHNKRLQARDPEDPNSFKVRRGKVGGFVDYFDEDELAQMARMVDEQLSPFYGYGSPAR